VYWERFVEYSTGGVDNNITMEVFTNMISLYGTQGSSHYDTNGHRSGHSHTQS